MLLFYFFMYLPFCGGSVLVFVLVCITLFHSSLAIILKRKRELAALFLLYFGFLVTVNLLQLSLAVPWVGLQFMIVVFPDHTHLRLEKRFFKH